MTIDGWIPYLSWTWPLYFGAHLYVTLWAGLLVWSLPKVKFERAVCAYVGMIVVAAVIQIAIPAEAPWPSDMESVQQFVHESLALRPYACLPSMHVALSVLPAGIGLVALESRSARTLSVVLALLITVSTLTMKEHFFLDAVVGNDIGRFGCGVLDSGYRVWLHKRCVAGEYTGNGNDEVTRNCRF